MALELDKQEVLLGPIRDVLGREVRVFTHGDLMCSLEVKDPTSGLVLVNLPLNRGKTKDLADRLMVAAAGMQHTNVIKEEP